MPVDGPLPEKALIEVLDENEKPAETIPISFYPTEYSIDKSVTYGDQSVPGLSTPVTQFVGGDAETLSMELLFDTYEAGLDVRETYTDRIDDLLRVEGEIHAPPKLRIIWGGLTRFTWLLQQASKQFTLFDSDGTPVRARMSVTFKRFESPRFQRAEDPPQSADRTRLWVVTEGETVWSIAAAQYGDPGAWRVVADANGLTDPRTLVPGTELDLPPIEP